MQQGSLLVYLNQVFYVVNLWPIYVCECTNLRSRIELNSGCLKIRLDLVHKLVTLFVLSLYIWYRYIYRKLSTLLEEVSDEPIKCYILWQSNSFQQSNKNVVYDCTSNVSPVYCLGEKKLKMKILAQKSLCQTRSTYVYVSSYICM